MSRISPISRYCSPCARSSRQARCRSERFFHRFPKGLQGFPFDQALLRARLGTGDGRLQSFGKHGMVPAASERVGRYITRHPIHPTSRLLDLLSPPPSLVETEERLLRSLLRGAWIQPAGNQKSDHTLASGDKEVRHLP